MSKKKQLTPEDKEKINTLSKDFAEKYKCTYLCAKRSVARNYPSEENAEAEIDAKCNHPCLVVYGVYGAQRECLEKARDEFYTSNLRMFPYLHEPLPDTVALRNEEGKTLLWEDVYKCLTDSDASSHLAIIFLCGLPPVCHADAANYEKLYHHFFIQEGVQRTIGFTTVHDGYVPLMDYFTDRNRGRSAAELAAVLSLCVFSERDDAAKHGIVLEVPDSEEENQPLDEEESESRVDPPPARPPRARKILGNCVATSLSSRQDKGNVQLLLKAHNLNYIRSVAAYSGADACAKRKSAGIDFPVIVKPVSGAGSEFISLCSCDDEIKTAFEIANSRKTSQGTLAGHMIVEEYIDGPEYVVNAVGHRDNHVVTDVWKSKKFPAVVYSTRLPHDIEKKLVDTNRKPTSVTSTTLLYDDQEFVHSLSDLPTNSEARRIVDYTLRCLTALGMYNGCSHCELRIDDRKSSPRRGQPVLIELNPRLQGDAPRATGIVGYDQYTLFFYLAAVSSAFPENPRRIKALEERQDSLPWPPAPRLYRSLHDSSVPLADRQTVRILFLNSPFNGVLCTYGARKIQALPTFKRTARTDIFDPRPAGFIASVFKTMDLLSSPGALLLEGTESQLERDAKIVRQLEQGNDDFNSLMEDLNFAYQKSCLLHDLYELEALKPKVKELLASAEFPPLYITAEHFHLLIRLHLAKVLSCEM